MDKSRFTLIVEIIVIIGIAGGVYQCGHQHGEKVSETYINQLIHSRDDYEKKYNHLNEELDKFKNANYALRQQLDQSSEEPDSQIKEDTIEKTDEIPKVVTAKIPSSKTHIFFEGLSLSVIGINYEGDPLSYHVTAVLNVYGKSTQIEKARVGYLTGVGSFEVLLVETDTYSATFRVTRLTKFEDSNKLEKISN